MNLAEYFRVVSLTDHVMYVEMSGFWSDSIVEHVGKFFLSRFKAAVDEVAAEGKFIGLADLKDLAVLSRKGRIALSQCMSYAKDHGLQKVVEIVPNAVAALSVREAAELTGKDDFRIVVRSLEDALPIVDGLVQRFHAVRPVSLLTLVTTNECE